MIDLLNTLKRLRDDLKAWVTNNLNAVNTKLNNKVDKEDGKGLSSNDFTNDYKTKLDNLSESSGGISVETDPTVPAWAKEPTKPTYTASEIGLGNVNNTSDMDKPVSIAMQGALGDLKNDLSQSITLVNEEWRIVDNNGNIVATIDASGINTTNVTADNIVLDGSDLKELLENASGEDNNSIKFYAAAPSLPMLDEYVWEELRIPIKIRIRDNNVNASGTGNVPYYRYEDRELVLEPYETNLSYSETFTIKTYPGGTEVERSYTISITRDWDGWMVTNDSDGVITFLVDKDITLTGSGDILTTTSKNFSVVKDYSSNFEPAIKIGNTVLSESKLNKLIAFIDGIESGDPAVVEAIAKDYLDNTVAEEGTW